MRLGRNIIVLVGGSGSGKTTIGNELAKHGIPKLVTATTRPMRANEGEVDGESYYFMDAASMNELDVICPTIMKGNQYGLPVFEIEQKLDAYGSVHVVLDKTGAYEMKNRFPRETFLIYIPTTLERMRRNMEKRGDSEADIQKALRHDIDTGELEPPTMPYLTLVNDGTKGETVAMLLSIFGIKPVAKMC